MHHNRDSKLCNAYALVRGGSSTSNLKGEHLSIFAYTSIPTAEVKFYCVYTYSYCVV